MSSNQLHRMRTLDALINGYITNQDAAHQLSLSIRQVQRLKQNYLTQGIEALTHKNRYRAPANKTDPKLREEALRIYQEELKNYNFSHACDVLQQEHHINIKRPTFDRWLREENMVSPKAKKRPAKHRSRKPRAHEGELAQMDASPFDWLNHGTPLHLHGVIDDATGKPLALFLDYQETREGYRQCMIQMNANQTLPQNLYTDGRTLFFSSRKDAQITHAEALGGIVYKETAFARGLRDLGIVLIRAHSPQAKGAIERLWGTLQDRLPKDFQRLGITTIDQANEFLKTYILWYQDRFAVLAAQQDKKYVSSVDPERIAVLFAPREFRMLSKGYVMSVHGKRYVLPASVTKKVPTASLQSVEIAIHEDFGLRALFLQHDLICEPQSLEVTPSIPKSKRTEEEISESKRQAGLKGKANSPWSQPGFAKSSGKIAYEHLTER